MKFDYPKMLYHIVEGTVIVNNEAEEKPYIEDGWVDSPIAFNEAREIEAKIEYHESQLKALRQKQEAVEVESVDEKRKPGRPRKTEV